MIFRAGRFSFDFGSENQRTLVMGIVNVTPDSFSDGGQFFSAPAAIDHALRLAEQGADIIDIGGESTRPGATPVSEPEEQRRVLPVIESLAGRVNVPISIDTRKPGVAAAALQAGASIINDVAAHRTEPGMWELAASSGAGYVLMHMQGTPETMQVNPAYQEVVGEILEFFREQMARILRCGVAPEQIVLDPGIGFGKNLEHNLQLLAALDRFTIMQRPVLLGVSRKSLIDKVLGSPVADRLPGSLACAVWGALHGVNIVRAHDVAATRQALRLLEEIRAWRHP